MAEIKINISNLETEIGKLQVLEKNWSANDVLPPVTVGGGKVVNEFEALAKMYKDLNDSMVALVENTKDFLTAIKNSYQESDKEAADNIVSV